MSRPQETLRINREEKRFLGVCAGIADYLDLPVLLVRIIFVVSILTWPTLILAYFAIYICLDKNITSEKVQDFFSKSDPAGHFQNLNYRRPIYRNIRNKRIAGVCSGLADYLEVSTLTVRILAVVSLFILGPYALLAYVIGWIAMAPNPAPRFNSGRRHRYKDKVKSRHAKRRNGRHKGFTSSRINVSDDGSEDPIYDPGFESESETNTSSKNADEDIENTEFSQTMEDCADIYYTLESRLREVEAFMTSKKFRLHCEINRI
jgi:phage shock protein PspC (stress-responsive transcriptional regulator)